MADPFQDHQPGLDSNTDNLKAINPSDTEDLDPPARALWVGTGGDLAVEDYHGNAVTLKNVPSGSQVDGRVRKVLVAGTSAADIVAKW